VKNEIPLISIVIVNYNGKDFLESCLDSVFKSNFKNFEVILVDNASNDESHIIAKNKFKEIILINNSINLGPGGRNFGIKKAKGKFIVLLDFDTIVTPNWLNEFLDSYEKHGYGLYQGKLLFMDDPKKINSAGCMINIFGFSFARGSGEIDSGQYDNLLKINFPASACAFIPRDIFDKVGYFDTNFFAYVEDTDFGWRALLHGLNSYFVPKVIVFHKGSPITQWSAKKFFYLERNRQICLHSNYSKKTLLTLSPFLFIIEFGIFLLYFKRGMFFEKINSNLYILKNQKYIKRRYFDINSTKRISDNDLVKQFSNEVWTPNNVLSDKSNQFFNKVVVRLSLIAKYLLKQRR
jgi:GT2 family glycosyltransferase